MERRMKDRNTKKEMISVRKIIKLITMILFFTFIAACLNEKNVENQLEKPIVNTDIQVFEELGKENFVSADKAYFVYPENGGYLTQNTYTSSLKAISATNPDDDTISTELDGLKASVDVSTSEGFVEGDELGIFIFINQKIADYITSAVVVKSSSKLYVQYKQHATDASNIITIGNGDGTGSGTAKGYNLQEGENQIELVVINLRTSKMIYVGKTQSTPILINVDSINPTITIKKPLGNNRDLSFDNTAAGSYEDVKISFSASDNNKIQIMAAILKDGGVATSSTLKAIDTNGAFIKREGVSIGRSKTISVSDTDLIKIWIDDLGNGAGTEKWYLYIMGEDDPDDNVGDTASFKTNTGIANTELTWNAKESGKSGNKITISLVNTGTFGISVTDEAIIVNIDQGTTSAEDIAVAVNSNSESSELVFIEFDGDGKGKPTASSGTLTGGGVNATAGNITLKKILINPKNSIDLDVISDLQVKIGDEDAVIYTENMQINNTKIELRLWSDDKSSSARIVNYETLSGQGVEEIASKAMKHEEGANTYTVSFDLATDMKITNISSLDEISLMIEMSDETGNSKSSLLKFRYIDENTLDYEISDEDISFDRDGSNTLMTTIVPDNEEDVFYLANNSEKLAVLKIANPDELEYTLKVVDGQNTNTYQVVNSNKIGSFNISDITFNPASKSLVTLKFYYGDKLMSNKDVILLDSYSTKFNVETMMINQNESTAYIEGTLEIPLEVKDIYKVQVRFVNDVDGDGVPGESVADKTGPWMTIENVESIDNMHVQYKGIAEVFNGYDVLQLRVYNDKLDDTILSTNGTFANLKFDSDGTDDVLDVNAKISVVINSISNTDSLVWTIADEIQDIDIDNADLAYDKIEIYLNDELKETLVHPITAGQALNTATNTGDDVEFSKVDFTGEIKLTIIAYFDEANIAGSAVNVTSVKRDIELRRATEKPSFISVPANRTWYGEEEDTFIIKGEVVNTDTVSISEFYYYDESGVKQDVVWNTTPTITVLNNGSFYSPDLTLTTYTNYGVNGLIEGEDYTIVLKASITGGAEVEEEFTAYYDTTAPTEYLSGKASGRKKFPEDWVENEAIDVLYIDENGVLKMDSDNSNYNDGEIDTAGTDYEIETIGGNTLSFLIAEGDVVAQYGYFAIIKNQKGYNDYLVAYVAPIESDGDYNNNGGGTPLDEQRLEDVTVVIETDTGIVLYRKNIKSTDTGNNREIFLDLEDNLNEELRIYMVDNHFNQTEVYELKNTKYIDLVESDFEAKIEEGALDPVTQEPIPWKEVKISEKNLKNIDVNFYKNDFNGEYLGGGANLDLSSGGYPVTLSGNVEAGDVIAVRMNDKYGNDTNLEMETYGGIVSITVKDLLIPMLPTNIEVTNQAKIDGKNDIVKGKAESGATIVAWGRKGSEAISELVSAKVDDSGNFSLEIDGDVYVNIYLEVVDDSGNSTVDSQLHGKYQEISDKFARTYIEQVTGVETQSSKIYSKDESINLSWNAISDNATNISKGNILKHYKIAYEVGGKDILTKTSTTNSTSIKPSDLGEFNLSDVTVKVTGVSALGFEGPIPGSASVSMDSSVPKITGLDSEKILASVKNNIITLLAGVLNETVVGKGTGDTLTIKINGIAPNSGADWNFGDIINESTFTVMIEDKAGNKSTEIVINSTDDLEPEINQLYRTDIIPVGTNGDKLVARLKHKTEDRVTVIAFDDVPTAVNAKEIGRVKLLNKDTVYDMNINSGDTSAIYIVIEDELGNTTKGITTKRLSDILAE